MLGIFFVMSVWFRRGCVSLRYENEQCDDIVAADKRADGAVDVAGTTHGTAAQWV